MKERKKQRECDGLEMFSLLFIFFYFFLIIDQSGALELVWVGGPASGTSSAPRLPGNDLIGIAPRVSSEAAEKGGAG